MVLFLIVYIKLKVVSFGDFDLFEYAYYEQQYQKSTVDVRVSYRPQYSENHSLTTATFFEEFRHMFQTVPNSHSHMLIYL